MISDLLKFGITPRKTFSVRFPKCLNRDLIKHFWRGVIDGDGYISFTNRIHKNGKKDYFLEAGFCGNQYMVKDFYDFFLETFGKKLIIFKKKQKSGLIYGIKATSYYALKLLEHLYGDASIYMDRKYEKYKLLKMSKKKIRIVAERNSSNRDGKIPD